MASTKPVKEKAGDESAPSDRLLRVDQIWSKKDRQWHFVKTAKVKSQQDRFRKYTLVVRRVISIKGVVRDVEVDIKSPKLAAMLLDVFKDIEGMELTKNPPKIDRESLFHAYEPFCQRLQDEEAKDVPDKDFIQDLKTAQQFVEEEFGGTFLDLRSLLAHGEITYQLLWALFRPKDVIFTKENALRQPQAMQFSSSRYCQKQNGNFFAITARMVSHDGHDFGWADTEVKIPEFEGTKKIINLSVLPLQMHPDAAALGAQLLQRGRVFVDLMTKPVCREYRGVAVCEVANSMTGSAEERFLASGRIMVDPVAFRAQNPNADLMLMPWVPTTIPASSLTDDDLLFCNYRALGFSFAAKKWGTFAVSSMTDVIWNRAAFDRLILDNKKRRLISSLVLSHRTDEGALADIIADKSKGLVGLLSGSPGVGKTLTAEAVAELSMRPLYSVSAGELGTEVNAVDKRLGMVLDITRRWRCVLLIDEADVFLYKRGESQLERNAVVSVFLRRLEYFQGIVILTTNRQRDIDEAFKSRIHFKFHYPPLDQSGRREIWKNFIISLPEEINSADIDDANLQRLAERPMNGREIKNAMACAASIVRASKEPLTFTLLVDILESLVDGFEDES